MANSGQPATPYRPLANVLGERGINILGLPEPIGAPHCMPIDELTRLRAEVERLRAEIDVIIAALKAGHP